MRIGNLLLLYPSEWRLASMTTMFSVVASRVVLLKCTSVILSGLVLLLSVTYYVCSLGLLRVVCVCRGLVAREHVMRV